MKASGSAYRKIAVWAVAISLLFSTAILARAGDDIRIYLGVVKQEIFASDGVDTTKRRSYLIVNQTVNQVAMITLADGSAFDTTLDANVRITMPYNPAISKDSRTFIYISSSNAGTPVNTYRWRSTSAPVMVRLAPGLEVLAAKRFEYEAWFYAVAGSNYEDTATFTLSKSLTLAALITDNNTASAIQIVRDYLISRNMID